MSPDPIEELARCGMRVIWVNDLDGSVILVHGEGIVLADADLERADVCDEALRLLAS